MRKVTQIKSRKADHIKINLQQDVQSNITTGLERIGLVHQALPDLALEEVVTGLTLFGHKLSSPVIISSMTGGTISAGRLNMILAETAQICQVALGLGSFRAAIDQPELVTTYQVRKVAPDILLFANLGAVELNYNFTSEQCLQAVNECNADALILHLNPLQEALQPEGETDFSGLIGKIERVCHTLPVPVIVKEVGWGISVTVAKQLINAGVAAIDVAGAGGTSWSQVEMHRVEDAHLASIAAAFRGWGIPTAHSIRTIKHKLPHAMILASGGLRDGIDIVKCIALGATAGGMAGPFLQAAAHSLSAAIQAVDEVKQQIKIAMFATGAKDLNALSKTKTVEVTPTYRYDV